MDSVSPAILLQKIEKTYPERFEVATKYYSIISIINSLHLTPREIDLLAFTAIRGSISGIARDQFVKERGSSKATIANMVGKLSALGYLYKNESGKIQIHPKLALDFSKDIGVLTKLRVA